MVEEIQQRKGYRKILLYYPEKNLHFAGRFKESCLYRLIKAEDLFKLEIVPAQRE
jgi:hypothetical protein